MVTSFLVAAALALIFVLARAYSFGEDMARSIAKSERARLQGENPGHGLAALDEDAFLIYFEWLRIRRFWLYLGLFAVLAIVETLVVMTMLGILHTYFYPGPWLWGFLAVFILTIGWAACVWATLWLHRTRRDAALIAWFKRWPGPPVMDDEPPEDDTLHDDDKRSGD